MSPLLPKCASNRVHQTACSPIYCQRLCILFSFIILGDDVVNDHFLSLSRRNAQLAEVYTILIFLCQSVSGPLSAVSVNRIVKRLCPRLLFHVFCFRYRQVGEQQAKNVKKGRFCRQRKLLHLFQTRYPHSKSITTATII